MGDCTAGSCAPGDGHRCNWYGSCSQVCEEEKEQAEDFNDDTVSISAYEYHP